jgi:hypothetical protein
MDPLVRRLAEAGSVLPEAALREAAAQWEQAAPPLLVLLESYAAGHDRSDAAAEALFFALFLFGQMREARAFRPLCRLALDAEAMERALGDGITGNLAGILAGTWDGSLETLTGLMEASGTDEFIRHAAFGAFTLLAAEGRIEAPEAVLRAVHRRMAAREDPDGWAWIGWVDAVALLGLGALQPQAQEAFRRRRIDPALMGRAEFEKTLRDGIGASAPEARRALLAKHHLALVEDTVALLSTWHAFTEAGRREAEAARRRLDQERLAAALAGEPIAGTEFPLPAPAANPWRDIGRNDPCPCGSGRKFKKCCLERSAAGHRPPG